MMRASAAGLVTRKQQIEDFATQITDDWLWFQLNRQEGATVDKITNHSGKLITTEQTLLSGTSVGATIWSAAPGKCTPAGTAYWDYHLGSAGATDDLMNLFNLSTLGAHGGLLVAGWITLTGATTTNDVLLSVGASSSQATYGEWQLYPTASQIVFMLKNQGGSTSINVQTQSGLSAGDHHFAFYIDAENMIGYAFVDGVEATGSGTHKDLSTDGTGLPAIEGNRGIRLLGRATNASGGTGGVFGNTAATLAAHDIVIRRFDRDANVISDIPELVADMYAAGRMLLPASFGSI